MSDTLPDGAPTPPVNNGEEPPPPAGSSDSPPAAGPSYTAFKDVGVAADRNARHRRTMEDAHVVVDKFAGVDDQAFFGVFDGHGGKAAALFCQQHFPRVLEEELAKLAPEDRNDEKMEEIIKAVFARIDEELKPDCNVAGACVAVCLICKDHEGKKKLYSANCGDARSVLRRGEEAIQLTIDHKPKNEEEAKRVAEVGGFIKADRVNGMLAVTRAVGDHCMKTFIPSEPYVKIVELCPDDTLLILACDGVWDILSIEDACNLAVKEADTVKMARRLLISSIKGGSTDNITAMVVSL